jgi:hypothetical protein
VNDEAIQRYPLQWPTSWKRTPYSQRRRAKFAKIKKTYHASSTPGAQGWTASNSERLTIGDGIKRVAGELRRMGVLSGDWLISSDVPTRLDGLPYANAAQPKDPGVAVYFRFGSKREPRVLACDAWDRVADNLAAIAGHIEAIRAIDRYGVGTLEQAFAGYAAIPVKTGGADWRSEMGFRPDEKPGADAIDARYKALARERHPDSGGSHEAMARLNVARTEALKELEPAHV